jgi:formate hydrogenlyase subunit 3/multisubunit Na+/H+ antiporter MnhD subunit
VSPAPLWLLAAAVLLILAAGIARAALSRHPAVGDALYRTGFGAGGLASGLAAIAVLAGAPSPEARLAAATPGGPWVFGLDALSAVFLLAVAVAGTASALYGVTYLGRAHRSRPREAGVAHLLMAVLVAAMMVVVAARAVVPFLIAWEIMALAAYFLVVFEHQRPEVGRAGLLYLALTHAGTLALFALFAAWAGDGRDLTFAALAARAASLPAGGALVLVLALLGFGVKAGLVPLHVWLPEAHAAAPSHVSAVMSGVVIKMGIYGLMRVVVLLGAPPAWWGWLVVALGAASGVLGVLWALAQHDLKRLLAFHSVENVGIILLGIGAGSLGVTYGHPAMAVLGFAGAALHTLNHALFKSLLFFGAGAVAQATGTRDVERLGGLARRMPGTAAAFLVGAAAIVGLPPLNGFVSEWLVYRSLLPGAATAATAASATAATATVAGTATMAATAGDAARLAVLAVPALALIGALALACFVKVIGIVFLGHARDDAALAGAREAPPGLLGPAFALAAACAVIGLVPALVLAPALRVGALVGHRAAGVAALDLGGLAAAGPMTVFALALAAALMLAWLARLLLVRGPTAAAPTWGCGYPAPTPRMQYTASSFAAPLLLELRPLAGVHERRTAGAFATHAVDPVLAGFVLPAWRGLRAAADRLRPVQRGRLALDVLYVVAALLALLLYLLAAVGAGGAGGAIGAIGAAAPAAGTPGAVP